MVRCWRGNVAGLIIHTCTERSEDMCHRVMNNITVRVEGVARRNGGHTEHLIHRGRSAVGTWPHGQPWHLQQRVSKYSKEMQNLDTSRGLCKQAGFTGAGWGAFVHSRPQDLSFHMPDLCSRLASTWPCVRRMPREKNLQTRSNNSRLWKLSYIGPCKHILRKRVQT
jgi:hypothetical protein